MRQPAALMWREAAEEMMTMHGMTSKAHVEYDPAHLGVRAAIVRGGEWLLRWQPVTSERVDPVARPKSDDEFDAWLRLPEEDARALYEALADYFGHAGHDIRALRKDYDAERARVDKLIQHATRAP